MKNFSYYALTAIALLAATGCAATSTRAPVTGFLYTDASAGESAGSDVAATKTGEACAASILGLIGTGDASINTAAKKGGITQVAYVDGKSTNILGLYATYCTVVHGE